MGTIVNVLAIIAGGIIGLVFKRFLTRLIQDGLMKVNGLATLFLALSGGLAYLHGDSAIILLIVSLALGTLVGEALNIEGLFERFGEWLKVKSGNQSDGGFVSSFLIASFTVCIGAMAIVGSLQDGLQGNPSVLYAKSILDFTIIAVMAGSMSKGVIFSCIPVGILQGSITLLARFIAPVFTEAALNNISMCGSVMIFAVGINLIWPKTFRVANQLPALLFALAFSFLPIV